MYITQQRRELVMWLAGTLITECNMWQARRRTTITRRAGQEPIICFNEQFIADV